MFWFVCFTSSSELYYCSFCHDIWLRNWFLKIAFDYNNTYKCGVLFVGMGGDKEIALDYLDCRAFSSGISGWCRGIVANMGKDGGKEIKTSYSIVVPNERIISGGSVDPDGVLAYTLELLNRQKGFIHSIDSIIPVTEDMLLLMAHEGEINRGRRDRVLQEIHPQSKITQARRFRDQLEP